MLHFADRLIMKIKEKGNPVAVGLDLQLDRFPEELKNELTIEAKLSAVTVTRVLESFGKAIMDGVADLVPAIKMQLAYFEQYGIAGMQAMANLCDYAKSLDLVVIADGKRNDIESTANAYADAYLGEVNLKGSDFKGFGFDALTVNPYLGLDGIKPFVEVGRNYGKGIFVLVKTSNPSSRDFQDLYLQDGIRNFEYMAHCVESWGADEIGAMGFSLVGAVVGATNQKDLKRMREMMPNTIFLMPGYGVQGATADMLKEAFTPDGLGVLVNSSRAIIYAHEQNPNLSFVEAARKATIAMCEDIKHVLKS